MITNLLSYTLDFSFSDYFYEMEFKNLLNIHKQACCAGCRRRPSPNEDPPIGKIHPFSKIAVTFEPLWDLESS